jgi:polyisoprenoid-binding protein YceI
MSRRNLVIGALVVIVILIAGSVWLYDWVLGDTEAASGQVSAPTLALETTVPTMAAMATDIPPTESVATVTPEPTQAAPAESSPTTQAAEAPADGLVTYQIAQEESQVSFNIFEELRGAPKDVIGTSNQVAGEVAVNLNDLSTAQIGQILINARTLVTDDDRRNQAIRNRILRTDQYEFITFTPTQITGLSGSAQPGQTFTFKITGDLTIQDVTQPATFDVTIQVESANRLTGTATTVVSRSDYNLIVPDLPFIANVSDEVKLEINFVLVAP